MYTLEMLEGISNAEEETHSPWIIRRTFGLDVQALKVTLRTDGN